MPPSQLHTTALQRVDPPAPPDFIKAEKNLLLAAEILGRVIPNNSPAPPKDQGDISRWRDEFAASVVQLMRTRLQPRPREPYELDWPALRKYYGVTEAAPSPIKIAVALTAGDTNETQTIERQVKFVGPDQSHPSLLPITQTRFSQDPVVVLRRVEEATLTTYVLNAAWSVQMSGPLANAASAMLNEPARRLLSWIRVLDGDDIEITDPRRMPIVAAGMIAPLVHSVVKSNRPLPSPAPIAAIHCDVQWPRLVP